MRTYTPREADYTLDRKPKEHPGEKGILLERTKVIKAGNFLEVEIFPVVEMIQGIREKRHKPTREAQKKVNIRNSRKRLYRLGNANFGTRDYLLTLTTEEWMEEEEMKKRINRFTRKMRELAKKKGMPCKYIYVVEITGHDEGRRFHVHMVMNRGFCEYEEIEKYWPHGSANVKSVRAYPGGMKSWCLYITKNKATQERMLKKGWACSKNLKKPTELKSDRKFSRAACAKIERETAINAKGIFEKKYPGYRLIEQPEIRYSDWMPGAYIYAMMERAG